MNALVLYESKFGNTERIAETIALALQESITTRLCSVEDVGDLEAALHGVDLLVVGGPTQAHGLSPGLREHIDRLGGRALVKTKAATFDTRLHGARAVTGSAAIRLSRLLRRRGAWLVVRPASFRVEGREGPLAAHELEHARGFARDVLRSVGIRSRERELTPVS